MKIRKTVAERPAIKRGVNEKNVMVRCPAGRKKPDQRLEKIDNKYSGTIAICQPKVMLRHVRVMYAGTGAVVKLCFNMIPAVHAEIM